LRLTIALGGTRMTYLFSALLYYLLAGGTGLGMYQFMQDGSFLPSNLANVALLWGIYLWVVGRHGWAGAAMGVAGLFHLNHALVGCGLWIVLSVWKFVERRPFGPTARRAGSVPYVIGTLLGLVMPGVNIALAVLHRPPQTGALALGEFVDLYVRLRHAHHYHAASWPVMLWVTFLLPVPFAVVAWRRVMRTAPSAAVREAGRVFVVLGAMLVVAMLGAGVWYIGEALVQASLWRFSIYVKLLSCVGAAWLVCDAGVVPRNALRAAMLGLTIVLIAVAAALVMAGDVAVDPSVARFVWTHLGAIALMVLICAALLVYQTISEHAGAGALKLVHGAGVVAVVGLLWIGWGRYLGLSVVENDPPDYLEMCAWARDNTPVDAVFLVPPHEQSFRLHARRAIYINFKAVAQLSDELAEWRDRMELLLGVDDLRNLPRGWGQALPAMRDRYEARSAADLFILARENGMRYVLVGHDLGPAHADRLTFANSTRTFFLYDVTR
ncbi:MAG: DUF6798 domain-containing protein, partial [Tepidisphaeraceae bacterium]